MTGGRVLGNTIPTIPTVILTDLTQVSSIPTIPTIILTVVTQVSSIPTVPTIPTVILTVVTQVSSIPAIPPKRLVVAEIRRSRIKTVIYSYCRYNWLCTDRPDHPDRPAKI